MEPMSYKKTALPNGVKPAEIESAQRLYDYAEGEFLAIEGFNEHDIVARRINAKGGGVLIEGGRESDRYQPVTVQSLLQ
jgi:hypothetical protein